MIFKDLKRSLNGLALELFVKIDFINQNKILNNQFLMKENGVELIKDIGVNLKHQMELSSFHNSVKLLN